MSREDIINLISKDRKYINYCRYVCKGEDYYKDLYQYVIEYMCLMDEDKLIEVNNGSIEYYIKRIMYINANNKTTPFWKEYLGGYNIGFSEVDNNITDETLDDNRWQKWKDSLLSLIEDTLEDEESKASGHAWDVGLFRIWMKYRGNSSEVARNTGIPYTTVIEIVNQIKRKINENIDSY